MNLIIPFAAHLTHDHGPLQEWIEQLFIKNFGWEEGSAVCEFFSHFTYDLLRTFLVLLIVLLLVSYLKTYISAQAVQKTLMRLNRFAALFLAAIAGIFSSTCVCTNVPLFFGFLAFGVPIHIAMTYLISSSLLNIASVVSMAALVDWRFTLCYVGASLIITMLAGFILSFFSNKNYIRKEIQGSAESEQSVTLTQRQRWEISLHETKHTYKHQWFWILIGVLLSALINSMVNLDFAQKISDFGILGIFFAACLGAVLHTDIISILPVLSALLQLHVSFGLLFTLSVTLAFISVSMIPMVKNAIKLRYLFLSWGIVFVLSIIFGILMMPLSYPF